MSGKNRTFNHTFSYWRRGPLPRRELSLMPRLGFPGPQLGMAAGVFFLVGNLRARELTLVLALGFRCPRARMAAGVDSRVASRVARRRIAEGSSAARAAGTLLRPRAVGA